MYTIRDLATAAAAAEPTTDFGSPALSNNFRLAPGTQSVITSHFVKNLA